MQRADAIGLRYAPGPRIEGFNINAGQSVDDRNLSLGAGAMTPAGDARASGCSTPRPRRFPLRLRRPGYRRRGAAASDGFRPRIVPSWRRLALPGFFVVGTMLMSMVFVDAPANAWALRLPRWFIELFDEITRFRPLRHGYWCRSAALMLLTAIVASRALDRVSRAVLALLMVRLGFVFVAVGLPGLVVTVVKRWIGRVRPSAQGRSPMSRSRGARNLRACRPAMPTTAFAALVAIGLIFPRARPALWAYALLIAASRIVVGAHYPSDVIAGAAAGACGALLVRDWFGAAPACLLRRSRRSDACQVGPTVAAHQTGCGAFSAP